MVPHGDHGTPFFLLTLMDTKVTYENLKQSLENSKEWGEDMKEAANVLQQTRNSVEKDLEGMKARMQELQQAMARPGATDFSDSGRTDAGLFAQEIANQLSGSQGFTQLAQSGRGMVPAQLAGRKVLNAIGNAGKVGVGSGSIASNPERLGIFGEVVAHPGLIQLIPTRPTDRDSVEFVRISSTGDVDVQAKEGDEKAEVNADGTLVKAEIVTIAGHTTASRQVLSDQAQLGQALQSLLSLLLLRKVEQQVLHGTGGDGQIQGLVSMATPFTPSGGAANLAESIGAAVVDMVSQGFSPSLIVCNPVDWFKIVTLKDGKGGGYLMGNPAQPIAPSLWNRAVAQSSLLLEGTALVLDTAHISLLDRQQIQVLASEHHKDNFTRNLVTLLAELRVGLEVRHAGAVRKVSLA